MAQAKTQKKRAARRPNASRHTQRRAAGRASARGHSHRPRHQNRGRHHNRGRYHNPSLRSGAGLLVKAGWTIAGAVGARVLAQFALGARNTGVVGYIANAAAALGLGYGLKKFMRNPQAGDLVTLGGFVGIVLRLVQEYTPFGQIVTSQFAGVGDLGIYGATTFFTPLAEVESSPRDAGNMALPGSVTALAAMAAKAQATAGVSGVGGGRYASGGSRYSM